MGQQKKSQAAKKSSMESNQTLKLKNSDLYSEKDRIPFTGEGFKTEVALWTILR